MVVHASPSSHPLGASGPGSLTPQKALAVAWCIWLGLLLVPLTPFGVAILRAMYVGMDSGRTESARHWLLAVIAYAIIAIPVGLFIRSRCFRDYWQGRPVSPWNYLLGEAAIWVALASTACVAAAACLMTHTLAPTIFPAVVALIVYFTLYPSGQALIAHPNQEDPAQYDEPR